MNKKQKIILSLILVFLTVPLLTYLHVFNSGLSKNAQDWGAFGSYLSGIYSPILGLGSVIVLVATLKEMRESNRQDKEQFLVQLESAEADKKLSDIILLTEMLNKLIDTNPTIKNRNKLPDQLAASIYVESSNIPFMEQHELYEQAINIMRTQRSRFSSELHVLTLILKKVDSIRDEDSSETAKTLVKGLISDSYRFWLYCYAQVWSIEAKYYLKKWHDFCLVPEELEEYLNDGPDIPSNE